MHKIIKSVALTVAATVAVGVAGMSPAAAENEGCVGFPSIPATFLCIVDTEPTNATPDPGPDQPVHIPELCYFIDCIPAQDRNVPTFQPSGDPVLVFTYMGTTYSLPGPTPSVDPAPIVAKLNDSLNNVGVTVNGLCGMVAGIYNDLGLGYMVCA